MKSVSGLNSAKENIDAMLAWVRGRGRVVIVVHDNPDPDCLASAMALRHLFVMKLNKDAVIAYSGIIGRSENIAMVKELQIPLTPIEILNISDYQVVCMLDTQPGTGNNSLSAGDRVDIVIDHHPLRDATRRCRWVDVREEYGVTSTILYEYLQSQNVSIGTSLATALFYAIKSETQDLGREANQPDRDAYHRLFPITNKTLLNAITHPKLPVEYFQTVNTALHNAKMYGAILVSNLAYVVFPDLVAEMADFLLQLENIDTVLCMGLYNNEMIISIRTSRHDLNLGDTIRRIVAGKGVAGGHAMMAGGKITGIPAKKRSIAEMENFLTRRLLEELSVPRLRPSKLTLSLP
jgi:nanoRNase/pAp phosphatase (c-di-AMP/oligoRNAs hydrolase)